MGNVTDKMECPACRENGRDRSGDNLILCDNGSSHCFACGYDSQPKHEREELTGMLSLSDIDKLPTGALNLRGISKEVASEYGVRVEYNQESGAEENYYAPLYKNGSVSGWQRKPACIPGQRSTKSPPMRIGDTKDCLPFGAHITGNSGKFIIVTEGVEDCLAVRQMLKEQGKNYRVVASLGTSTWKKNIEWFIGWNKVVIAFDQDSAGKAGSEAFASALGTGKGYILKWNEKAGDPNNCLLNGLSSKFMEKLFNVEEYRPDGVLSGEAIWKRIENYVEPEGTPYPPEWVILNKKLGMMREAEISLWCGGTGCGKCLAPDTPILMYDGSVKKIVDIKVGDLLMGIDGSRREVLSRHTGISGMYKVAQKSGMSYVVNERHTMSLVARPGSRRYVKDSVVNIDLPEYLELPAKEKRALRGWVPPAVEFAHKVEEGKTEPYLLGLWLAEGSENAGDIQMTINQSDYHSIQMGLPAHKKIPEQGCYRVNVLIGRGKKSSLNFDSLIGNKHVPDYIRFGSLETRKKFLAGYLDGDGSRVVGGIEAITKHEAIADGVVFVARSLGYRVRVSDKFSKCPGFDGAVYKRILIKGDTRELPMLVKRKQLDSPRKAESRATGVDVSYDGVGEYVGIEVDGDKLFMLEDWTVVHNTTMIRRLKQHIIRNTERRVGEIELEEAPEKTFRGLLEFQAGMRVRDMTPEVKRKAYEDTYGTGRIVTLDHRSRYTRGGSLMGKLKYLHHAHGANIIMLDHITLAVSEFGEGNGGLFDQDKMMAEFLEFVESTKVHLCLISHLRKSPSDSTSFEQGAVPSTDSLKGSGSLKQIAFDIIGVSRNTMAVDERAKNTSQLHVLKNREEGNTGAADRLYWDNVHRQLIPAPDENDPEVGSF